MANSFEGPTSLSQEDGALLAFEAGVCAESEEVMSAEEDSPVTVSSARGSRWVRRGTVIPGGLLVMVALTQIVDKSSLAVAKPGASVSLAGFGSGTFLNALQASDTEGSFSPSEDEGMFTKLKNCFSRHVHRLFKSGHCAEDEEKSWGLCFKKCSILTSNMYPFRTAAATCCKTDAKVACLLSFTNAKTSSHYAVAGGQGDGDPSTPSAPYKPTAKP